MGDKSLLDRPDPNAPPVASPRRTFLVRLAAIGTALWGFRRRLVSPAAASAMLSGRRPAPSQQPDATVLAGVAAAVLPAELGAGGTRRAVSEFQRWVDEYRPGAEANHGYGTARIQQLPADPRPRWRSQLAALDEDARRRHGKSFAALSRADQQAMLRPVLTEERGETLPTPLTARHVALALLAHFYDSPAATDLCYEATIGRQQCRPLSAASQQPTPLIRRGQ